MTIPFQATLFAFLPSLLAHDRRERLFVLRISRRLGGRVQLVSGLSLARELAPSAERRQEHPDDPDSNAADDVPRRGLGESPGERVADLVGKRIRGIQADDEKDNSHDQQPDAYDTLRTHKRTPAARGRVR
jgi:hypothetical protein